MCPRRARKCRNISSRAPRSAQWLSRHPCSRALRLLLSPLRSPRSHLPRPPSSSPSETVEVAASVAAVAGDHSAAEALAAGSPVADRSAAAHSRAAARFRAVASVGTAAAREAWPRAASMGARAAITCDRCTMDHGPPSILRAIRTGPFAGTAITAIATMAHTSSCPSAMGCMPATPATTGSMARTVGVTIGTIGRAPSELRAAAST